MRTIELTRMDRKKKCPADKIKIPEQAITSVSEMKYRTRLDGGKHDFHDGAIVHYDDKGADRMHYVCETPAQIENLRSSAKANDPANTAPGAADSFRGAASQPID